MSNRNVAISLQSCSLSLWWDWHIRCFQATFDFPSLYGLLLQDSGRLHALELFRNGHVELRIRTLVTELEQRDGLNYLAQRSIIEYTVSMLRLAKNIYEHLYLSEPLVLSLILRNVGNAILKPRPDSDPRFERTVAWPDVDLEIEPITADSLEHPDRIAKNLLDRVWQAFGFDEAPLFDADGNFNALR